MYMIELDSILRFHYQFWSFILWQGLRARRSIRVNIHTVPEKGLRSIVKFKNLVRITTMTHMDMLLNEVVNHRAIVSCSAMHQENLKKTLN